MYVGHHVAPPLREVVLENLLQTLAQLTTEETKKRMYIYIYLCRHAWVDQKCRHVYIRATYALHVLYQLPKCYINFLYISKHN